MKELDSFKNVLEWSDWGFLLVHYDCGEPEKDLARPVGILDKLEIEKKGYAKIVSLPYALKLQGQHYVPEAMNASASKVLDQIPGEQMALQKRLQVLFEDASTGKDGLWSDILFNDSERRLALPVWLCYHPTNYGEVQARRYRMGHLQVLLAPQGSPIRQYPELTSYVRGSFQLGDLAAIQP